MKNNKQSIFHKSKETVTYAEEMRIILKGVNIIMGVTCLHQCWPSCLGMYCVDWGTQTDAIYVIQKEPQRASTPHACRWEKRKMTYSTKCISTASPSILNAQQHNTGYWWSSLIRLHSVLQQVPMLWDKTSSFRCWFALQNDSHMISWAM